MNTSNQDVTVTEQAADDTAGSAATDDRAPAGVPATPAGLPRRRWWRRQSPTRLWPTTTRSLTVVGSLRLGWYRVRLRVTDDDSGARRLA